MKLLPDIQLPDINVLSGIRAFFQPKTPAAPSGDKELDIDLPMAAILAIAVIVVAAFIGEAFLSRTTLNWSEENTFLNTFLLGDILIFSLSVLAVSILWYMTSAFYGSWKSRSLLRSKTVVICGVLMLLPLVFIGCDLAFKPLPFGSFDVEAALALSLAAAASMVLMLSRLIGYMKPGAIINDLFMEIAQEQDTAGLDRSIESARSGDSASSKLRSLLKKLYVTGDMEPVYVALDRLKERSMALKSPFKDPKAIAVSTAAASLIVDTGIEAAKDGYYEVTLRSVDHLMEISERSSHPGISALAFRGVGSIQTLCMSYMSEPDAAKLEYKLIGAYAALFDHTGMRGSLDLAAAMLEKAMASKTFTQKEHNDILYMAASIYRRIADLDESEEHAGKALSILYEALTASPAEVNPVAYALIQAEIGRSYMALARVKNPVKSYRSAAQAFEDAAHVITVEASPWDAASFSGQAALAYTKLSEEYARAKKYDESLESARTALALYGEAAQFFTQARSPEERASLMSNLGSAHTIISDVFARSRMFEESLKHASFALTAYSSAAKAADLSAIPERYAATKASIGLTYITMAEINFREQHYESAISACDSAIGSFNTAIRIFEKQGKEKPAAAARKYLKKANDLFNSMMRIGVTENKKTAQAPLLVEP